MATLTNSQKADAAVPFVEDLEDCERGTLRDEWEGVVSWRLPVTSLCCSLSWEAALGSSRSKYPTLGQTQVNPETEVMP